MSVRHILIVDDEPKVAFFLGKALVRLSRNYRISTANSAAEALAILDDQFVDLLITDLRMPDVDGLALIHQVQNVSPQTRTILITAYGSDEVEMELRDMQGHGYITKPFGIGELTRAVEQALRGTTVSRPGLTVLSDETFETILRQLEDLRCEIGALCVFLADMQGQRLAETGDATDLETSTLLALLAGSFATSGELARQFGNGQALNLNYHEGSRYGIYASNVGDELFLAIVYDRHSQSSRIGIVWLYARRAVENLLAMLSSAEAASPVQSLGADFGASLTAELDTLLTEEPISPANLEKAAQASAASEETGPSSTDLSPTGDQATAESEEAEQELFDLQTAIERGLLPTDFGEDSE
jgi:DNA-binding response OmpR family regulator